LRDDTARRRTVHRHRQQRRKIRRRPRRRSPANRVLRVSAFVSARPRITRLGRLADRPLADDEGWPLERDGGLIDDEVLAPFAIVGEPDQIAGMIDQRFGDIADRVCLEPPAGTDSALGPARASLLAGQREPTPKR
jgi:alkanesulfonate monooxygenase SsuD/methylene tetrahydromethanopterin reductase-like flavin-dependent oxidoreductase (luciferase family)